jgi:hypothetical protein
MSLKLANPSPNQNKFISLALQYFWDEPYKHRDTSCLSLGDSKVGANTQC